LAGRLRGVVDTAGSSAGCSSSGIDSSRSQTAPSGGRVTAAEAT
jgi:hypothetical protein